MASRQYNRGPFALSSVLAAVATVTLVAAGGVYFLGRYPPVTWAAMASLGALSLVLFGTAYASRGEREPQLLWPVLVVASLLAIGPAHFFGPNSAFAAVIAILSVLAGLLSRTEDGKTSPGSVAVYAALAGGQALLVMLALLRIIDDRSLVVVIIPGHPDWHHGAGHLSVQSVYLAAFFLGRALQKRYLALAHDVEVGLESSARQRALLSEARHEYQRALTSARSGILTGRVLGPYKMGGLRSRDETSEVYNVTDTRDGSSAVIQVRGGHEAGLDYVGTGPETTHAGEPLTTLVGGATDNQPHALAVSGLETPLPVVAMPPAPGRTLAEVVSHDGAISTAELRALIDEVAGLLESMHAEGFFHLELTPQVLLYESGAWKISGPGLRQPGEEQFAYAPPERFRAPVADARADVYGLSASVYLAACGHRPFADLDAVTLQRDRGLPARPPLGNALTDVLRIGLATDPDDRFESIAEAKAALLGALEGELADELRLRAVKLDSEETWRPRSEESAENGSADPSDDLTADPVPVSLWHQAYRDKIRTTVIGVTAVCAAGAGLFSIIIRDQIALTVALIGFAGIAASAWLNQALEHTRASGHWTWVLAAIFSAMPGYAIGYNSALAAFVAIFMFTSGLFQAGHGASWLARRGGVLVGACVATGAMIVLILTDVVSDRSNISLRQPGAPLAETLALHTLLPLTYAAAFTIGRAIDRRYEALAREARGAADDAAAQAVLLSDTRADVERLLRGESVGLFTSLRLGNYLVGELLGRGGMGEVYAAQHCESGARAALKVLRFDRVSNPGHLRLFVREAETLGQIHSPHVAGILEVGDFEDGLPFIAMEFIDGNSLAKRLAKGETLSKDLARAMVADIGAGLSAVHQKKIVHRDIKPANIIRTRDEAGGWKLVDFGVASAGVVDADSRRLILGTPRYMSPEQAAGKSVDARSDLYSLCLVLYRALTGCPALEGERPSDIVIAEREIGIQNPRTFADIGDDLELVLRIGLSHEPADRFESADELRDAFEDAFADRLETSIRERGQKRLREEPWSGSAE